MGELDPFDPANLRLPDSAIPVVEVPSKKKLERLKYFVMIPETWITKLAEIKASASTYRVAFYLLRRRQITGSTTVTVGNAAVKLEGVGRRGKATALRELQAANLVEVKHRRKKSPT